MEVTKVRIKNFAPKEEGICASASITLDNCLCIHQIHVINGRNGLFVAFPNTGDMKLYRKGKRYVDIVHPCKEELREHISKVVLAEYEKVKEENL